LFGSLVISGISLSRGHIGSGPAVRFLLPVSDAEKAVCLLLSLTAGTCAEAVNRGYLQRQFAAWTRSAPTGIIL